MSDMPPPRSWDDVSEPPDLNFLMPEDPFDTFTPPMQAFDYLPEDDLFDPFPIADLPAGDATSAAAPPSFSRDDGWGWHDTALIAMERATPDGEATEFAVGALDLYANAHTGDLGGSYLEIDRFDDLDEAAAFYHQLQGDIHERQLLPFQLVDYAADQAQARAAERGEVAPTWAAAEPAHYATYEDIQSLNDGQSPDIPPADLAFDSLFDDLPEQPVRDEPKPNFKALRDIGITVEGFDPDADPPPFIDPQTGTAYWIGVFQPDKDDPTNCVTSILTLGRDAESGEVEAQLAPCVPGDWDKAYNAAEYLLGVVEKGGIERVFDAAEGMALASGQRELWQDERGIPLAGDAAQDLADYSQDQWELDL